MRVMMLLKSDAPTEAGAVPSEACFTAMGQYSETLVNAGVMRGGEGLLPSSKGARIRIERGKTTVTDGPFAEAKELVAGYFLLETKSLGEAVDWAKRLPADGIVDEDHVELRPLYEPEDFPVDPSEKADGWRDKEAAQRAAAPESAPDKGARWVHLLKADRNTETEQAPAPSLELLEKMGALMQEMSDRGVLIGGDGLKPSSQGKRVYIGKDKRVRVVDGPFSESKELVAGFCLFRAHTKAEAIEWARRCLQIHVEGTGIESGEIEVRPIWESDDIPVSVQEKPDGWREQERRLRERIGQ